MYATIHTLRPLTIASLLAFSGWMIATDDAAAKGPKHGSHHHLDVTPYGLGYGYHDDNFGIHIGPFGGGDYGPSYGPSYGYDRPYYDTPYYDRPVYVEPPPRIVRPVERRRRPVIQASERAAEFQYTAEQAFRDQRYQEASRLNNHALVEDSQNGKLHLFASQCLFAVGDYRAAAAAIHQGLSLLEQKDWGYVVENYGKFYTNSDYVRQMKRLVQFNKDQPDAAYARLVRGYHYVYLGHEKHARVQLKRVLDLQPGDQAASRLLTVLGEEITAPTAANEP